MVGSPEYLLTPSAETSPPPSRGEMEGGLMKKILYILFAVFACTTLQSCLQFDEPGDELGFGQVLNPDTENGGQNADGDQKAQ